MIDTELDRVRTSKLRAYREFLYKEQGGKCGLCQYEIDPKSSNGPVLDHDHKTGRVRSVLHRFCNSMVGKEENHLARTKMPLEHFAVFAPGSYAYISADYSHMPYHPKYRTEEEKRARRNLKAKIRRQKRKEEKL